MCTHLCPALSPSHPESETQILDCSRGHSSSCFSFSFSPLFLSALRPPAPLPFRLDICFSKTLISVLPHEPQYFLKLHDITISNLTLLKNKCCHYFEVFYFYHSVKIYEYFSNTFKRKVPSIILPLEIHLGSYGKLENVGWSTRWQEGICSSAAALDWVYYPVTLSRMFWLWARWVVSGTHQTCRVCARSVTQSCPALCHAMDCNPPGSSVHGILQARVLEWVAISFCRGSSPPRDWTQVSCIAGEPPGKAQWENKGVVTFLSSSVVITLFKFSVLGSVWGVSILPGNMFLNLLLYSCLWYISFSFSFISLRHVCVVMSPLSFPNLCEIFLSLFPYFRFGKEYIHFLTLQKKLGGEWIRVYVWPSPFDVYLKLPQDC